MLNAAAVLLGMLCVVLLGYVAYEWRYPVRESLALVGGLVAGMFAIVFAAISYNQA